MRSLLLVAFLLVGCAHRAAVTTPETSSFSFDVSVLGDDALGLAEAAARLCNPLVASEGRALGFSLAQRAHQAAPSDPAIALGLARCAALHADLETDSAKLVGVTDVGIAAAKVAGAPDKDPRAAYWLGVNLGLALRLRGLEAIALLPEELATLKNAQSVPEIDLGGPLRVLGMLYLKAPAWPAGPGDLDLALELLEAAATKYPSHPLNHLFFAMALREEGDGKRASAELQRAADLARPELWGDWAKQWQQEIAEASK